MRPDDPNALERATGEPADLARRYRPDNPEALRAPQARLGLARVELVNEPLKQATDLGQPILRVKPPALQFPSDEIAEGVCFVETQPEL